MRLSRKRCRQSLYFALSFCYQFVNQDQTLLLWLYIALTLFIEAVQTAFKFFSI